MDDWRSDPATEQQREFSEDLDITLPQNATKGEASKLIDAALERRDADAVQSNGVESVITTETPVLTQAMDAFITSVVILLYTLGAILVLLCFISIVSGNICGSVFGGIVGSSMIIGGYYWRRRRIKRSSRFMHTITTTTTCDGGRKTVTRDRELDDLENIQGEVIEPTHAKPGTFDPSDFTDPKTGHFRFPKYRHDNQFLVKITDTTDYRDVHWDSYDCDAEERRDYTLRDFEDDLDPELTVEGLHTLFYKKSDNHLDPLTCLTGQWSVVERLLVADEEIGTIIDADCEPTRRMLNDGYLFERVATSDEAKLAYFGMMKLNELRAACSAAGLKTGRTKQETIDRMITSKKTFDLPRNVVLSPIFYEWLTKLITLYVEDIRANANRFHPGYIRPIWEEAQRSNDVDAVVDAIDDVLRSRYWLDLLSSQ